jgi:pimeloyl-ACP methyl ester carboxylesterase
LLAELAIEKAGVIGNGLGGEVALNLAADAPELIDRLVLIAPTGCRYSPFTPVPMEGLKAMAAYRRQPSPERMAGVLRLLRPDPASVTADEASARHAAADNGTQDSPNTTNDRDPMLLAPSIAAPTLLLWGREDRFSPLDYGLNLLARFPDARFHLLPKAGHNAQLDAAAEVNAMLCDFLEGSS